MTAVRIWPWVLLRRAKVAGIQVGWILSAVLLLTCV